MEPFEPELREHFRQQEPSFGFSHRVMARVRQEADHGAEPQTEQSRPKNSWLVWNRWATAATVAACLAVGIEVQRHPSKQKLEAAQVAEAQLAEQLFFAGEKINEARDRVWGARDERGAPE